MKNNNNKNKINNNNIIENKNNLPSNNNKHNINNKYLSSFSLNNYFISYSSIDDLPNNINISVYFSELTSITLLNYNSSFSSLLIDQNPLN